MAVDTAQKRASISSGLPWEVNGWPDNTIGAEDRAQLSGLYAGVVAPDVPAGPHIIAGSAPDPVVYAAISGPLGEPLPRIPLPLGQVSGQITWELGGGVKQITVGLNADHLQLPPWQQRHAYLLDPAAAPDFGRVDIVINGDPVARGRAEDFTDAANGLNLGFIAFGPSQTAMADDLFYLEDEATLAPGALVDWSRVFAAAIDQAAPGLRPAMGPLWPDTGKLMDPADADLEYPYEIAAAMTRASGFTYQIEGDEVRLVSPTPPAVPDYIVPFDETTPPRRVVSKLYTRVLVRFRNPDGSIGREEVAGGPLSETVLGFKRVHRLSSTAADRQAAIAAGTEWLRAQAAAVTIGAVKRSRGQGLERWGGGKAQTWEIRPGEWLQVADQPMQQITRVVLNLATLDVTVYLGPPAPRSMAAVVTSLLSDVVALRNGRDPLTRGRTA